MEKNPNIKRSKEYLKKQMGSDWSSYINKIFLEKENSENNLENIEIILEIMRENKSLMKKTLNSQFIIEFINKNNDITVLSLLLKDFLLLNEKNNEFNPQIKRNILERLKKNDNQNLFENNFCDNILKNIIIISTENNQKFKELLSDTKKRIKIIYENLIYYVDEIKSLDNMETIFIKWILLYQIDHDNINEDFKILKELANLILPQKIYGGSKSKINFEKTWKIFKIIFEISSYKYNETDNYFPFANIFIYLEGYKYEDIKEIIYTLYSELERTFSTNQIINVFKNLTMISLSTNVINVIYYFSMAALDRKNYDILLEIFDHIILKLYLNKLKSEIYFIDVEELIKFYLFGTIEFYTLQLSEWSLLMSNYKYLERNSKEKYIKEYYYLIKSIFKYYNKNKKLMFNEREVLNFLDNIKLYNDLRDLSDNQEKEYYEYIWNLKKDDVEKYLKKSNLEPKIETFKIKYKGMKNMGNTCYLNSFVQCLFATSEFKNKILNAEFNTPKLLLLKELKNLFVYLTNSEDNEIICPIELKATLPEPFSSTIEQQDALEFGRIFLDNIENLLKETKDSKLKNLVDDLFFGEIKNVIECKVCKKSSIMKEKLMDLSVNFSNITLFLSEINIIGDNSYIQSEGLYDLKKMISNVILPEEFKEQNQYFCDNCKKLSDLTIKTPQIEKLPPILMITPNRFYFDPKLGSRRKICHKIKDCFSFDSQELFSKKSGGGVYKLFGIIVHSGASMESGHYFNFSNNLNEENSKWFLFNDLIVQCLGETPSFNKFLWDHETPYIYFFMNELMFKTNNLRAKH